MSTFNQAHALGDVRTVPLVDDVLWLEHSDPGTARADMSTNAYAVLARDEALLFDAAFEFLMPAIEAIAEAGHRPVALVLSHRHLVGTDGSYPTLEREYGAPVMLHPLDVAHPQAARSGARFVDPMTSSILARFGLEPIHFRGQTEGSVMLYRERDGLLLAGDSAMGTTVGQAGRGVRHLVRAPFQTNVDEDYLREAWNRFDRPVRHVAPLHGTPQIDQPDIEVLMKDLYRPELTGNLTGSVKGDGDV